MWKPVVSCLVMEKTPNILSWVRVRAAEEPGGASWCDLGSRWDHCDDFISQSHQSQNSDSLDSSN